MKETNGERWAREGLMSGGRTTAQIEQLARAGALVKSADGRLGANGYSVNQREGEHFGREPKPNKYGAVPMRYNGVRFASRLEARRAQALDVDPKVSWWVHWPRFRLGCPENVYVADFLVIPVEGAPWVEDTKGRETEKFRRDRKLWAQYGPCDLWLVGRKTIEVIHGGKSNARFVQENR